MRTGLLWLRVDSSSDSNKALDFANVENTTKRVLRITMRRYELEPPGSRKAEISTEINYQAENEGSESAE